MEDAIVRTIGVAVLPATTDNSVVTMIRETLKTRGIAICLTGIDGSGKTTLARQLVATLGASGLPVRHLHIYRWYQTVCLSSWIICYNRYVGRRVLIFDRSIYDNVAVVCSRPGFGKWLSPVMWIVQRCYPRFDHLFYFYTSYDEAKRRRPQTIRRSFIQLRSIYQTITGKAGHVILPSDEDLYQQVLECVTAGGAELCSDREL